MEPISVESGSVNVESIKESFFSDGLYDGRFLSSDYTSFLPLNSVENQPIEFIMPPLRSQSVYRYGIFQEIYFKFKS